MLQAIALGAVVSAFTGYIALLWVLDRLHARDAGSDPEREDAAEPDEMRIAA